MLKTARSKIIFPIAIAAAFMLVLDVSDIKAAPGISSVCNPSSSCTIGEFVYDDSYTIVTNATCSINSRYPDGSSFLNLTNITSSSDGWYGYSFTAPATLGYYRTQFCCVVNGQNMCLDKSFEVKESPSSSGPSASDIAQAVWSYSGRTLSGFGTLASDIWSYSDRTLSSFGSLVSSVWNYASRTLTGSGLSSGSLATKSDVESLSSKVESNSNNVAKLQKSTDDIRLTLEKLVNKPIIQNFVEDESLTLDSKISQTKSVAESLFINSQFVRSKTDLLVSRWNNLSKDQILDILSEVRKTVGEKADASNNQSLYASSNWLSSSWDWKEAKDISDQVSAIDSSLADAQRMLAVSGKGKSSYLEIKSLSSYLGVLEKILGNSADLPSSKTLYGRISDVQALALNLGKNEEEADKLILMSHSLQKQDLESKAENLSRSVLAINRIPRGSLALNPKVKSDDSLKQIRNKILGIKALISANKIYLVKGPKTAFANTWLEEGSIVFKSLVTNPSTLVKQTVPLKYYLPPEVKEEDIIEVDDGISVKYDTEKNQYYVEGEFDLAPGETKTISVRVNDIWVISRDQIDSLRKQAEELSRPLERTAYFAQGVTLKSDIDVSLDKIINLQKNISTPEQKIKAYREAQIELSSVNQKMDSLKSLVAQASSASSYFGFIGGAQVLTVWGIVMVVVAGIVLLFAYMRSAKTSTKKVQEVVEEKKAVKKSVVLKIIPFILVGALSALVAALIVRSLVLKSVSQVQEKRETALSKDSQKQGMVLSSESEKNTVEKETAVGGEEIVRLKPGTVLKEKPDGDAKTLVVFDGAFEAVKGEKAGGWVEVAFKGKDGFSIDYKGWVKSDALMVE
jgi:hypothetical protein